jgi:hypothetical protein
MSGYPAGGKTSNPIDEPRRELIADVAQRGEQAPERIDRASHLDNVSRFEVPNRDPSCAILVRTYHRDAVWLTYCLAGISRWCTGFDEVVVVAPHFSAPIVRRVVEGSRIATIPTRTEICRDARDDYLGQQVTKLYADKYTDADLICHLDTDCIMQRPMTPADLCEVGRPRVVRRPTVTLGRHRPWVEPTQEFLGWQIQSDYMQCPPFTFWRWLYPEVRAHAIAQHGIDLAAYVLGRPPRGFSEFNVLGAFAERHHKDAFAWRSWDDSNVPQLCKWFWSRDPLDNRLQRELARLVHESAQHDHPQPR